MANKTGNTFHGRQCKTISPVFDFNFFFLFTPTRSLIFLAVTPEGVYSSVLWGRLAATLQSSSTLGIRQTEKQFHTLKTSKALSIFQTTHKKKTRKEKKTPGIQRRRTNQKRKRRRPPAVTSSHTAAITAHTAAAGRMEPSPPILIIIIITGRWARTSSVTQQEASFPPGFI